VTPPRRRPWAVAVPQAPPWVALALVLTVVPALTTAACTPAETGTPAVQGEAPVQARAPVQGLAPDAAQALDRELREVARDFELMGLAVILLAGGEMAWEGYVGRAVHEPQRPLGPESVIRMASISKTATALALMQLVERGEVELDADVSQYLGWKLRSPAVPEAPLTLRMLLGHTSGIRDGEGYGTFTREMVAERLHLRELFEVDGAYFTDDMFAAHPPGAFFSYSNAAWGVIASVVEAVSGERFDRYTREHIFDPLGMQASFNPADFPPEAFAALYRQRDQRWEAQVDLYLEAPPADRGWEGYVPGTNGLLYAPQGGLRATAPALARLALALMHGGTLDGVRILDPATLDQMKAPHWSYDGTNGDTWDDFWMSYGLGIHRITNRPGKDVIFPDRTLFGHAGIAYGLLSDMYVDAETGSGVIFVTTGSARDFAVAESSAFYAVEAAVLDRLHPVLLELERDHRAGGQGGGRR
jgi:CubicO group peptidase (beta-lactamase class C family)